MTARPRTTAVLPIKRFSLAKSRLRCGITDDTARAELAAAMAADVLDVLTATPELNATVVVTGDPGAAALAQAAGAQVVDDAPQSSHSHAAQLGVQRALADGAQRVLLIAGDCPLLDPAELARLLAPGPPAPCVVAVTDRRGHGTNALLLAPPDVIRPSFGGRSRDRHRRLAHAAGASWRVVVTPTLELDVDTAEDLAALDAALTDARAARTRGTLNTLAIPCPR